MLHHSRRAFLGDVSRGMIVAGLGTSLAADLGFDVAFANEGDNQLSFGKLRPLITLMQETAPSKLQPMLIEKLKTGKTNHKELITAAALANAETFGGDDYVGFHTEMALLPAYQMLNELPEDRQALPVLKVLYRNTERIQQSGRQKKKAMRPIEGSSLSKGTHGGELLQQLARQRKKDEAQRAFKAMTDENVNDAYNNLLWTVTDEVNVHRFVLAHRSWALIDLVGQEHAHTMLRQCVRFCSNGKVRQSPVQKLVPKLLNQYRLLECKPGKRDPGDKWVAEMSNNVYWKHQDKATEMIAASLADGISPEVVGEAISLAANQLALRQDKRGKSGWRSHGDSPGVHASDAINAWRNIARVCDDRNVIVGLMVGAYHTARYHSYQQKPFPLDNHRAEIKGRDAKTLLTECEEAIRSNEQGIAAAAIQIYGENGFAARPVFDLLLRYAISEDGRLHSEKYYRTVVEEYRTTRKAYRWRQLVALARVTASMYGYNRDDKKGYRAAGYEDACKRLGVEV